MMTEDDHRKTPPSHELGQDLSSLSIDELDERVLWLEAEIERLKEAKRNKEASRKAADSFFR